MTHFIYISSFITKDYYIFNIDINDYLMLKFHYHREDFEINT